MPTEPFSLKSIAVPAYGPTLLYGLATGAILPVIALTARDLGASVPLAALIITLTGIGSLVTNVPATVITTRFGERGALVVAAAWCAAAMVTAATVPVLGVFALSVFMVGMAGSVFGLARQSYLTEAVPLHMRARALSTLGGVNRIGVFAGPFISAGAMHFLGTPGAYWTGAVAALGAGLLSLQVPPVAASPAYRRQPEPSPTESSSSSPSATSSAASASPASSSPASSPTTPSSAAAVPAGQPGGHAAADSTETGTTTGTGTAPAGTLPPTVRRILRSHARVFRTVGVGVLLIAAVRATRQAVIPLWAQHLGLDPTATSLIYGLSGAIDMLIFYPAGKVMDRFGRRWIAVPCMLTMGAGLALLPLTSTPGQLLAVAMLIGFGNGIGSGIVMTLGADFSPSPGRPQFLGIWRLLADLGTMGGPALLSGVTALAALPAGIAATAVLGFLGAGALWAWVPKRPGS
ncbi:Major Facilitator Superfamily protein [Arthrobacter saudimassiliensis]|uniref:Major Facilitator Superfamily protein n=1 Tax=Arthrobacter saudimassiliensis TaxID=1461584 RepID=A0A078MP29_9MICC|nr:Major Facilitator Superfamily protein [Arthrobacter saudimassiliensis]